MKSINENACTAKITLDSGFEYVVLYLQDEFEDGEGQSTIMVRDLAIKVALAILETAYAPIDGTFAQLDDLLRSVIPQKQPEVRRDTPR